MGLGDVVGVVSDAPGVTTLRLALAETPEFLLGQYYLVRLAIDRPPGVVQQAYSVSSSPYPSVPEIEVTVREVPGDGPHRSSPATFAWAPRLQVRGPFGFLSWTEDDGGPLVLIGAGSGVAPLVSIVRCAAARRAQVSMTVLCSSHDRGSVLFRRLLEELAPCSPWLAVSHTFTRSPHDGYARSHRRIDVQMVETLMIDMEAVDTARDELPRGRAGGHGLFGPEGGRCPRGTGLPCLQRGPRLIRHRPSFVGRREVLSHHWGERGHLNGGPGALDVPYRHVLGWNLEDARSANTEPTVGGGPGEQFEAGHAQAHLGGRS